MVRGQFKLNVCICIGLIVGAAGAQRALSAEPARGLSADPIQVSVPYPTRAIHIVVPFPPGGAVDAIARGIGQRISEQTAQSVIIDNRPGGSANLGTELVAHALADGYTLLMGANGLATNMTLFPQLSFDALRDFAPIARIGEAPVVLVVPVESHLRTLAELISVARAKPGQLSYGSAGNGSSNHLAGEMLKSAAQIDVLHVPYKGGAPALTDLIGGRISFMLLNTVEVLPQLRSGRVRALATGSRQRLTLLPDTPTLAEAGLTGFEASVWWGLLAPAQTPRDIVHRLNSEVQIGLASPVLRRQLNEMGVVATPGTEVDFTLFLRSEVERWGRLIRAGGLQAD